MRRLFLIAVVFLSVTPVPGRAQMMLPSAVGAPTPAGQSGPPPAARRPRLHPGEPANPDEDGEVDRHFVPAKPPAVESVIGKPFALSGSRGALQIEKSGDDLNLSRLALAGDKISHPNQACQVAMGGAEPLKLKPLGAPDGVQRFVLDSSACPLQFDVLNGALRATSPSGACVFAQADCHVDAVGLWGPSGDSFSESRKKNIERERAALEKEARAHFRALLHRYRKDKPAAQAIVREQAAFAAERAQSCRDYDHEDTLGFCALRLTEARDYRLQALLANEKPKKDKKKAQTNARSGSVRPAQPPRGGAQPY